jgi:hypothetical protein
MIATTAADPSIIEQAAPALIGVAVTAALGLGATWLGWRRGHRDWLRDRRLEAYAALTASATKYRGSLAEVWVTTTSRAEGDALEALMDRAILDADVVGGDFAAALALVEVVGPAGVVAAANAVDDALDDLYMEVTGQGIPERASARYVQARDELTKAARLALGA